MTFQLKSNTQPHLSSYPFVLENEHHQPLLFIRDEEVTRKNNVCCVEISDAIAREFLDLSSKQLRDLKQKIVADDFLTPDLITGFTLIIDKVLKQRDFLKENAAFRHAFNP